MKILFGKSQIALRKCKVSDGTITAAQIKTLGTLENLIRLDKGYKFPEISQGIFDLFSKSKKD